MPDKSVQECYCSLLLYSADLVEMLELEAYVCCEACCHTRQLLRSHIIKAEKDVREASPPFFGQTAKPYNVCLA